MCTVRGDTGSLEGPAASHVRVFTSAPPKQQQCTYRYMSCGVHCRTKLRFVSDGAIVHDWKTCCNIHNDHALTQNRVCQPHAQGRACNRESNMSASAVLAALAGMSHNLSSCPPVEAAMTCSSSVPRNSACNELNAIRDYVIGTE